MVETLTPSAFAIRVQSCVSFTALHRAGTSGSRSSISVRWNQIPYSADAGWIVIRTMRPVCRPEPVKVTDDFRVVCTIVPVFLVRHCLMIRQPLARRGAASPQHNHCNSLKHHCYIWANCRQTSALRALNYCNTKEKGRLLPTFPMQISDATLVRLTAQEGWNLDPLLLFRHFLLWFRPCKVGLLACHLRLSFATLSP